MLNVNSACHVFTIFGKKKQVYRIIEIDADRRQTTYADVHTSMSGATSVEQIEHNFYAPPTSKGQSSIQCKQDLSGDDVRWHACL